MNKGSTVCSLSSNSQYANFYDSTEMVRKDDLAYWAQNGSNGEVDATYLGVLREYSVVYPPNYNRGATP